jgi:hypothetical protein
MRCFGWDSSCRKLLGPLAGTAAATIQSSPFPLADTAAATIQSPPFLYDEAPHGPREPGRAVRSSRLGVPRLLRLSERLRFLGRPLRCRPRPARFAFFCGRPEAVFRTSTTSRSYTRNKPMTTSASHVGISGKAKRIEIRKNRTGTRWRREETVCGLRQREETAERRRLVPPAAAHQRPPRDRPAPASPRNTQNHHATGHMV